ncbi:MAG: hypothetical protein RIS43_183 [Actinomycetota bacterium]
MRKFALLAACTLLIAGCANSQPSAKPSGNSTDSAHPTASRSASASGNQSGSTNNPAPAATKMAAAVKQAKGVKLAPASSQVTCPEGATAEASSEIQMQAPDLDELFLIAMVGCNANGVRSEEVPEVFHWRNNTWVSVATIRVNNYTVMSRGALTTVDSNRVRVLVYAKNTKTNASMNQTLTIRRDGLSYWADITA